MQRSDFAFFHPLRVRYSEIDAQGIVYNAHYLTYFDLTITEYMRHMGCNVSPLAMQAQGKDFHVVKATVEYKAPMRYDDELEIHIRAGRVGRSSITWELAIFRKGEEDVLSSGEV
ncbi:MAG: acyl-CoA thioesterase, partial [Caldilineaceae bacterium]|nr:acyl-CoA thioesterase [Caldilineaceae bacterium]